MVKRKRGEQLVIPGMERKGPPYENCPKCGGEGWLWCHELEWYDGKENDYNDDTRYLCDWCFFDDEEVWGTCGSCGFVLSEEKICDGRFCITHLGDTKDIVLNGKDGYYQHFECPNCKKIIEIRRDY